MTMLDPRQQLANILAPGAKPPLYRKGKVVSLETSGSVWFAYVTVDGTNSRPRKMAWNGNGSKPAVDDFVYYVDASPVPLIMGRISTNNEDQDFGGGNVNAGSFTDGSGNLRTDLSSLNSSVSSLSSTVSGHTSTLSSHTTSINSLNNSVTTLNSTVAGHTSSITTLNASMSTTSALATVAYNTGVVHGGLINSLQTQVNDLANRVQNLETLLTYYAGNMDYLARLGAHYSGHSAHPPGAF